MRQSSEGVSTFIGGDYAALPGDDERYHAPSSSVVGTMMLDGVHSESKDDSFGAAGNVRGGSGSELPSPQQQEQLLRLNVFRELMFAARRPASPHCSEARPKHFPPEITVFHTGALYASVHKAFCELFPFYNGVYIMSFVFLLITFTVSCWGTPFLFQPEEGGGRKFNYVGYMLALLGLYHVSTAASFFVTRPAVKRFHERMEAIVTELAPIFRRVGYDLEYHQHETGSPKASLWSRLVLSCDRHSFVRIVPFRGVMSPEEAALASALWDPQRRSEVLTTPTGGEASGAAATAEGTSRLGEFRVAVYGAQAYPGNTGFGRELHFLSLRSLQQFGAGLDEYTWGAVASEMRPYVDGYYQARSGTCFAVLMVLQLPVAMTHWLDSWFVAAPFMVLMLCLYVFLFYPNAMEDWWMMRVLGLPGLDEIQATVERLAPLVEERSGCGLRFHTEPEGCLGGTAAYVCFVPRGNDSSSTSESALLV